MLILRVCVLKLDGRYWGWGGGRWDFSTAHSIAGVPVESKWAQSLGGSLQAQSHSYWEMIQEKYPDFLPAFLLGSLDSKGNLKRAEGGSWALKPFSTRTSDDLIRQKANGGKSPSLGGVDHPASDSFPWQGKGTVGKVGENMSCSAYTVWGKGWASILSNTMIIYKNKIKPKSLFLCILDYFK